MAVKEREPQLRPRYSQYMLHGLASPFSIFDFFTDIHLAESPQEADASALRRDWEIVGECIQDSILEYSRVIGPVEEKILGR